MNQLSNAFSLLELDVEDDRELREQTDNADNNRERANGKDKKEGDDVEDVTLTENDKGNHQNLEIHKRDYKLPLVWIDLEMTGLNIEIDRVLEIACVVTDGNLTKSVEGPDLVIHQTKECLDKMGEWCQDHHAASGLTEKVLQSTISEKEAEKQVIDFVKRHVGTYSPLLAGNSVYVDFMFLKWLFVSVLIEMARRPMMENRDIGVLDHLKKYMPDLASLFSHVVVDVSSVKALCLRWYPKDNRKAPQKENKHRAMDDIKESIAELKYYKEHIFKSPKSKK